MRGSPVDYAVYPCQLPGGGSAVLQLSHHAGDYGFRGKPPRALERTFPNDKRSPSCYIQSRQVSTVKPLIAGQFRPPEDNVRRRPFEESASVAVGLTE